MCDDSSIAFVCQVQTHALLIAASVWVVLVVFILNVLVDDTMKFLTAFLIVALVSLPVILVHAGMWATTVLVFVTLYRAVSVWRRVWG